MITYCSVVLAAYLFHNCDKLAVGGFFCPPFTRIGLNRRVAPEFIDLTFFSLFYLTAIVLMLTVAQSVKLMMRDAATGRYKNYTSQKNASFEHRAAITSIFFFWFHCCRIKVKAGKILVWNERKCRVMCTVRYRIIPLWHAYNIATIL